MADANHVWYTKTVGNHGCHLKSVGNHGSCDKFPYVVDNDCPEL